MLSHPFRFLCTLCFVTSPSLVLLYLIVNLDLLQLYVDAFQRPRTMIVSLETLRVILTTIMIVYSFDTGEDTVLEVVKPVDEYGFYHTVEFKHHNYVSMERDLKELSTSYPNITRLYSIGSSVQGRELYVIEITKNPGVHSPDKPEMKYVGNMHGNEVVGREMLLLLVRYLCENYGTDERVTRIVETVRLHVMPSMNPDGYEISKEGDVYGVKGRANAKGVDLNRNFPDHYEVNDVRFPDIFSHIYIARIYSAMYF